MTSLADNFPDQKQQVMALCGGKSRLRRKVTDVFKELEYSGAPELFTMWACLFADASVTQMSLEWLRNNRQRLQKACYEFRCKHGFSPHPGVLIETCRV